jgi:hypothetical protein
MTIGIQFQRGTVLQGRRWPGGRNQNPASPRGPTVFRDCTTSTKARLPTGATAFKTVVPLGQPTSLPFYIPPIYLYIYITKKPSRVRCCIISIQCCITTTMLYFVRRDTKFASKDISLGAFRSKPSLPIRALRLSVA